MAKELSLSSDLANLPAHLANRIGRSSALSSALAGGISQGESLPRISIKGGRFRLVEDGAEVVLGTTTIDVVIVGANPKLSKTWYKNAWDPNAEPAAPECYSHDGDRPHPDAAEPQHDKCATCPHNAWGSKIGPAGQKLKACSDDKRLAVVAADDPTGTMYQFRVTGAALAGLNEYTKYLNAHGITPDVVRTRIGFDDKASFPKATFKYAGLLDESTQEVIDTLVGTDRTLLLTGQANTATALPAPTKLPEAKKLIAPKEPEPAPVVEPEEPKAKGFKAQAEPVSKPKAAAKTLVDKPVAETTTDGLAAEIANLLNDIDDDA